MPRFPALFALLACLPLAAADGATTAKAVFGGGCFWFMQTAFREVPGVVSATVGYAGGRTEAPTYEQVCDGGTGHAEVVLVEWDPARVGFPRLLDLFFAMHDPSTKDRQGPDVGTQYRSALYTTTPEQLAQAERAMAELRARGRRITTELRPLPQDAGRFHPAEAYHQDYATRNPEQPYCALVVGGKLRHFRTLLAASASTGVRP
ncbi:MAG: peptide-methionine (S)-S-oxide reductase MsrA [Planctomycetota bacterium]|jgi:peptide-methionine (S)-S-oxide reductase